MFPLKLTIVAFLIAIVVLNATAKPGGKGGKGKDGKNDKHEKGKQCMKQTMDLAECCHMPEYESTKESMKEDPDCKHHLEGIEDKEGKEKHKAANCFTECLLEKKGLYSKETKSFDDAAVLAATEEMATEEFLEISLKSASVCLDKFKEMKEKWEKKEEEWKNNPENASENGDEAQDKDKEEKKCDKCSFLPSALMFCIQGNIVRNCPEPAWEASENCEALLANATTTEDCMNV